MTDDNTPHETDSRRTFLKKSAVTSGALLVGVSSADTVAAQDGGGDALMFTDEFYAEAQFRVISPVLNEDPSIEGFSEIWNDYNTWMIEYLNTNEEVYLFPTEDAEISEGNVYQFGDNFSLFDPGELIAADFDSLGDEFGGAPYSEYDTADGGGQALLRANNLNTGSLLEITSEVVEWSPRQDVQGTDIFTEYNTRHAMYLNTNDEFTIYPAQDADVEEGNIYEVSDQFEITDAEGNLVTVDLQQVDSDTLDEDLV